ncbi:Uncharacterised protein [Mycobacterium tuberculosis]|nr:Uncharacterised protein [Mycobacterium tuberculosis]
MVRAADAEVACPSVESMFASSVAATETRSGWVIRNDMYTSTVLAR